MSSIKVKCVGCGTVKTLSPIPTEQPMCENDLMPMVAVRATS